MTRSLRFVPVAILLLASFAFAGDVFVNSKWQISLVSSDSGAKDATDTIVFAGNTFTSMYFAKHGFKPCPYDEDVRQGNMGGFTVESKSDAEGKMKWTGMVTATSIRGDVVWTKANGDEIHYTFTGEKLPK